jgi:GINS complex subunit 4
MDDMDPCMRLLKELQIDRVRYLIASYLRARLLKIEKYAEYIIDNEEIFERLSSREQKFAKEYHELEQNHLNTMFLNGLPDRLKDSGDQNTMPEPDTRTFVFCKVREDIGQFQLGDEEIVNLNAGDTYVLQYEPIVPFIEQGQIDLI